MAIDQNYIPAFSLETVFLDKDTGEPLANGKIYFEQDNQRLTLKNVWQITGNSPDYNYTQLPNPITLSAIGTIQDSLGNPVVPYFFPFDSELEPEYYFVRVENEDGVEQFVREAVPYIPNVSGNESAGTSFTNALSNPQFVEVNFDTSLGAKTYNFSGAALSVTAIAPDWDMIVSGSGTVDVERIAYQGTLNRPTNPPYFLRFTASAGITVLQLRQRLNGSPNLWANSNVSSIIVGRSLGGDANIRMRYVDSSGNTDETLLTATFPSTNEFDIYPDNQSIPASTSADEAPNAYVDIIIDLPTSESVELTSIQVVGTGEAVVDVPYNQSTQSRQKDQLFHFYQNELLIKPKDTILTGWNFALNPWQFRSAALSNLSGNGGYVADQTIVITENADSVQVGHTNNPKNLLDIRSRVGVSQGRIAIVQYIDPSTIVQYWGAILSSLSRMRIVTTSGTEVPVKMRLIESTTLPSTVNPIASWGGVDPVFTGQWTAIEPENDPAYVLPNNYDAEQSGGISPPFAFNGFRTTSKSASTATLGIVLYTTEPMSSVTADQWLLNSVSLVPNRFAVESNPQSFDQVLRQCQFYYEKSYPQAIIPGSSTTFEDVICRTAPIQNSTVGPIKHDIAIRYQFSFDFEQVKRATPNITLYSPSSSTSNQLQFGVRRELTYPAPTSGINPRNLAVVATPGWQEINAGRKRTMFVTNDFSVVMTINSPQKDDEQEILFHYVADARLGIVP